MIKAVSYKNVFEKMRLSIEERKKYVISLHKRGYTVRQIAQELHMSTRDVVEILKENEREEKEAIEIDTIEKEEKEKKKLFSSMRSEALKLYKQGLNPLDVAIELKLSAEEAKLFYHEYCSLQYSPQFLQLYTELNNTNSFKPFTDLFYLIKDKDLSIEEAIKEIEMIDDISLLKEEHQDLSNKITDLKELRDSLITDNIFLKDQNAEMDKRFTSTSEKIIIKEKTLEINSKKVRQKEEEIYKINSGKNYYNARDKIKVHVEEFLGNGKNVIGLAVLCLFNAVKENHKKVSPIKGLSKSVYEYVSDSSDNEVYRQKLQDVAEKLWDSITDVCSDDVLNPSSSSSSNISELKR